MLAAPYTKWHCSQWNVDQAAAFVLCSTEAADRAGVPAERRVHPLAAVESNHMLAISRRAQLHRAPAARLAAERIADLTGIDVAACDVVDLYSCFPSAVRIQARELGLPLDDDGRPLSVGGGMTFGGGPLANPLGLAVTPDPGGQDALVPGVDRVVADRLADQVVGDRPDLQVVLGQRLALARHVRVVGQRLVHLEVVAPAGDLQPVVAPFRREPAHLLERQVSPLAGKQSDRACHGNLRRSECLDTGHQCAGGRDRRPVGSAGRAAFHCVEHELHLERVREGW